MVETSGRVWTVVHTDNRGNIETKAIDNRANPAKSNPLHTRRLRPLPRLPNLTLHLIIYLR